MPTEGEATTREFNVDQARQKQEQRNRQSVYILPIDNYEKASNQARQKQGIV